MGFSNWRTFLKTIVTILRSLTTVYRKPRDSPKVDVIVMLTYVCYTFTRFVYDSVSQTLVFQLFVYAYMCWAFTIIYGGGANLGIPLKVYFASFFLSVGWTLLSFNLVSRNQVCFIFLFTCIQ